jgi:hypothetical protein
MITDFLLAHAALVPVALLLLACVCVGVGYLLLRSRRHGHRLMWTLLAVTLVPVFALTLVPASDSAVDHIVCTVQFDLPTLGTVELLANVALFVPPVFLATLATRRPLLTIAAGSALSAAIEATQALIPTIGRACDSNDWLMNTIGTTAGVLLATTTIALTPRRATSP